MREYVSREGRRYAAIPNDAMRDQSISIEARGLLALLMTYSEHWVFRREHLMEISGMGRDKFERVMGELRGAGYVVLVRSKDAETGRMVGTTWLIRDVPQAEAQTAEPLKNHIPENPDDGSPTPIRIPRDKKTNGKNEETIVSSSAQNPSEHHRETTAVAVLNPSTKKKGTRLPREWVLPRSWGEWALEQGFTVDAVRAEAEKFRDYWISKAGSGATKVDWEATFRNWMRNSKTPRNGGRNGKQSQGDWLGSFVNGAD